MSFKKDIKPFNGVVFQYEDCPMCFGEGNYIDLDGKKKLCSACRGTGVPYYPKKPEIKSTYNED